MTPLAWVRGTMILATMTWAIGEALMRRSRSLDRLARGFWTIGLVLALVHVGLAFQFVYGWDHGVAVDATMRQTVDRIGWGWRGAIYVNYVFLTIWLIDVCWWWVASGAHASRSVAFEVARLALFTFMFLNGAVIFASGVGRVAGTISVALVVMTSLSSKERWAPA